MASPFSALQVAEASRPTPEGLAFDLDRALEAVVTLEARVPHDAFTANILGVERAGGGVVIGEEGLVLTIGYLVMEADLVILTTNDGRSIPAHALGVDFDTGLGLVHALEPLNLPALEVGDSRTLRPDDGVIVAGGGGRAHATRAKVVAREPFAGYWEYALDDALFTAPAHPHWSGAALIGPKGDLLGIGSLQVEQTLGRERSRAVNMIVPAELFAEAKADLLQGRASRPARPWLGVYAQEANGHVIVAGVAPGGPADRAEVRPGDVLLAVEGRRVSDLGDAWRKVWASGPAGAQLSLTLNREGDVFDVTLRSVDRSTLMKKRPLH
jgi:S1-C subfamily serine protease